MTQYGALAFLVAAILAGPLAGEDQTSAPPRTLYPIRATPRLTVPIRWTGDLQLDSWVDAGQGRVAAKISCPFELVETALAVEGGRVVEKRREYRRWGLAATLDGVPVHPERTSLLEGADLLFRMTGDEVTVESLAGPMKPRDLETFENHYDYLFDATPPRAVEIGEEWTVGERDLLPLLSAARNARFHAATLDCRLERVEERLGRTIAVISIRGLVTAQLYALSFLAMKGEITGEALFDVDLEMPIQLSLEGALAGESFELGGKDAAEIRSGGEFRCSIAWEEIPAANR